jgi:hypothetical protein
MNRETKKAAQDAYHEARAFGHTKEEARQIRDNWKPSGRTTSSSDDDDDDYYYYSDEDSDGIDYDDPDFDDFDY